MKSVASIVNEMDGSEAIDYLLDNEHSFILSQDDINKIKCDAVRKAKSYLLSNGFSYGASYKLDELIK